MATMALRAVAEDGTIKDIAEEDMYKFTRWRWVYNEAHRLSLRYLKFNLSELVKAAIKVTYQDGARDCVEVLKCQEGLNNKAFLLKMDNGLVVFAKLPNPCAGPAFYTTASEVATRTFLREALSMPIPRILAWSADANNPVGAEYIIEELVPGQPLLKFWPDWERLPMESRIHIIEQVVELEHRLAQMRFRTYGCIYFKKDYPQGDDLRTVEPPDPRLLKRWSALQGYCFGPLVERGLWKVDQTKPRPEYGPYSDALEFVKARGICEKAYVEEHGRSRMNYHRIPRALERPENMLLLLEQYSQLAPAMISPSVPEDLNGSTLWHPDLHLGNIFIDPTTMKITSIIDWQSAAATPLLYVSGVPKAFKHREHVSLDLNQWPTHPQNFDSLLPKDKDYSDNMYKSEHLHKNYLAITHEHNSRHWKALELSVKTRVQPVHIVNHVWKNNTVWFLQKALMAIAAHWEELCPNVGPCPVTFSKEQHEAFEQEVECREFVAGILVLFQTNYHLPPDGRISQERYEDIMSEVSRLETVCYEDAENDDERIRVKKLWPYQDSEEE